MQSVIAILASSILILLISGPSHVAAKRQICTDRGTSSAYCVQVKTGAPIVPKTRLDSDGMFPTFACPSDYFALCCVSRPIHSKHI
ncbi:hypothetical protein PGTUg99_022249 [Puccinia graminis f. sp. tritici]|uniref:Uncharacterized protein n=1 Tax=Puccinia graminis f. sp. tritici TaxID=56615 RepID=A0A5B0M8V9_PUCGR|nr:hypothetical protein PGTUg99_022249 [Puccinia graminis f. sp. tritici]